MTTVNTSGTKTPFLIARSGAAVSVTGTVAETTLATITIPANTLGVQGSIRITTTWSLTNSANNKTFITKFGGTNISSLVLTTSATYKEQRDIANRNATNSQVFFGGVFGGFGSSGAAIGTMAKDTTANQDVVIAAQLANTGETITLEAYTVEVLIP